MTEFDSLMQGMSVIMTPGHIGLMVIGVLLGILVGVLPGLGAPNGVALLLPLTFTMSPVSAIILLSCMYWGRCSAVRSPRSCSIFPASRPRWRPPSTATPWPAKAARLKP